MKYFNYILCIL